jgi:proteasome accessory factor A
MIEAEFVNLNLILEDPVGALGRWSHDPTLRAKSALCSGHRLTATELQLLFYEEAARFVAAGRCDGIVPRAEEIFELWGDTLAKLEARNMPALSRRLDWALKLSLLERALGEHPELSGDWSHPAIKRLDLVYSSLDPDEGLYWACENDGTVERVVDSSEIERFAANPPEDTRAWTRAMLLRLAGKERVERIDWDSVCVTTPRRDFQNRERSLELASPFAFTRRQSEPIFAGARSLDSVVNRLEASIEAFTQEEDTHNEHA